MRFSWVTNTLDAFAERLAAQIAHAISAERPRGMTAAHAAAYIGIPLALFERERPPGAFRIGDRLRWDRVALDRWIDIQTGSVQEIPQEANSNASGLGKIANGAKTSRKPRFGNSTDPTAAI
jgi:hypothetical protein